MPLPPFCTSAGKLTAFILTAHPSPDLFFFFAATLSLLIIKNPFSPPLPRRTLRPLQMNPSAHLRRTSPIFSSPESLSDYLTPRLPPGALASWGVSPGTKTVQNLFIEISSGETALSLSEPPATIPLRAVNVAIVRIRNRRGSLLVESHQLLSDGTVRSRNRPLSEKMRPGETWEEAVVRAVEEELGVAASGSMKVVEGSYVMRVEEKASVSYPGLPARYVLHEVEASVESLPEEGEFSTDEMGEGEEERVGGAVFVRKHFWKWIDDCDGEQ